MACLAGGDALACAGDFDEEGLLHPPVKKTKRQTNAATVNRRIAFQPMPHRQDAEDMFSAKGAAFILAWGSAPGIRAMPSRQR